MTLRLVLDTNAALDLWHFQDPRCALLRNGLASGALDLVSNPACREEFLRVLHYPALELDEAARAALIERFDTACELLAPPMRDIALPRCRDPDDQKFLELARDVEARALVTRDGELLKLSRRTLRAAGFIVATPEALASVVG